MRTSLQAYQQSRDDLLEQIAADLSRDERFVAAWLTGSYARNEADQMSDLDLSLVVADRYADALCSRHAQVSHETAPERLALFRRFGKPALIHENNNNAPDGGTFTFVMYASSAVMVDWILLPQSRAKRPHAARLLFDKVGVAVSTPPEPEELERSKTYVAEQWAFFWMMTAITAKYIVRGDDVFATEWLEHLSQIVRDIERRLRREPWDYARGSLSRLQPTRQEQIASIRSLCQRMRVLVLQIEQFTGRTPALPTEEIQTLLILAPVGEDHARD
jgi:predicted nucleotidyltransferase